MQQLVTISLFLFSAMIFSQSAPICIDGVFEDWNSGLSSFQDEIGDTSGIDFLEMQVSNDADFLFIRFITDSEFDLTTDLIPQGVQLYIDTDNNADTGYPIQEGYGSEVGIIFKDRQIYVNFDGSDTYNLAAIKLRPAPTVTSDTFEIAIGRDVIPDGIHPLFASDTIKILFRDSLSGDTMPDVGSVYTYTFDATSVTPLVPTDLEKDNPNFIRIVAYNTLFDGLIDNVRKPYFEKIITFLNPDIIGFSECYNTSNTQVKALLDTWLPLGTSHGWFVNKDASGDLITASRWQILNEWNTLYREYPVLINLPEDYNTDIVFTNAHLRCCNNNAQRQDQVDAYVSFMLDATSEGGDVNFPTNTPFVYAGDLNLVGYAQQLTTLITGDIQNTTAYGFGDPYDWDGTNPTDQICRQSDIRMAYTWQDDPTSYPPGRLDYMIYSDAVMQAEKSFSLNTQTMSAERLQSYGLNDFDSSNASDHFPVITDFSIDVATIAIADEKQSALTFFPNPVEDKLHLSFDIDEYRKLILFDTQARKVMSRSITSREVVLELSDLHAGLYYLQIINAQNKVSRYKIIKK